MQAPAWHWPPSHIPVGHVSPQPPQLPESVSRSVSQPSTGSPLQSAAGAVQSSEPPAPVLVVAVEDAEPPTPKVEAPPPAPLPELPVVAPVPAPPPPPDELESQAEPAKPIARKTSVPWRMRAALFIPQLVGERPETVGRANGIS